MAGTGNRLTVEIGGEAVVLTCQDCWRYRSECRGFLPEDGVIVNVSGCFEEVPETPWEPEVVGEAELVGGATEEAPRQARDLAAEDGRGFDYGDADLESGCRGVIG